jgi:hypothetical protein
VPFLTGVVELGGKQSDGGGRPHLGLDGYGAAAACSHDGELLQCASVFDEDTTAVVL